MENRFPISPYSITPFPFLWALGLFPIFFPTLGWTEEKKEKRVVEKMVNAIANRNQRPKIIKNPSQYPEKIPLFGEKYDWIEQARVFKALEKLHQDTKSILWEELVINSLDSRYSLTIKDKAENPENWTVGVFCTRLAYWKMFGFIERHLPIKPTSIKGEKIDLKIDIGPSLAKWRERRKTKTLYQLQIEICELAINHLRDDKEVPNRIKDKIIRSLTMDLDKLKKEKEPIIIKSNVAGIELYHPDEAKKYRQQIKKK